MADRYFHLDADLFHKHTYHTIVLELGPWGGLMWIGLIAQAKFHRPPGKFSWTTERDAIRQILGVQTNPDDLPFSFEDFLDVTGKLKQTRRGKTDRRRNGHVSDVTLTRYGHWQNDARTWRERDRKARYREENPEARGGTTGGTRRGTDTGQWGDRDLDLEDTYVSRSKDLSARARPTSNRVEEEDADIPDGPTNPPRSAMEGAREMGIDVAWWRETESGLTLAELEAAEADS